MDTLHPSLSDPDNGGLLLVDKPVGWSSFDVVKKLRGAFRSVLGHRVKVGHGGTLDPLASGLLLIGFGKWTKQLERLAGEDKSYEATLRLGATTLSYDAETPIRREAPWEHLTEAEVRAAVASFQGEFMQRPPAFSAKHVGGERAYFLARAAGNLVHGRHRHHEGPALQRDPGIGEGEELLLDPLPVVVHSIATLGVEGRDVRISVACGKGTYIRSLAHDIGQKLGCGAHLVALRRTGSGPHSVADALPPEGWSEELDKLGRLRAFSA